MERRPKLTIVGINTLSSVNSMVYSSHCKLWIEMKKEFPEDEFLLYTPQRMSIDNMRNEVAKLALVRNADYIFFVDDDVIVHPNTYKSLRDADKDIIMAMTFIRGYPFNPMAFKDLETIVDLQGKKKLNLTYHLGWEQDVNEQGLFKTGAIGFSCALLKCDTLKALDPPYFVTGTGHTEDVYYCMKARLELDPEPEIWVDVKVPTEHLLTPDAVSVHNVEKLREFYKPEGQEIVSRTKAYLEKILQEME